MVVVGSGIVLGNLNESKARAYCAYASVGVVRIFFLSPIILFSFSLSLGAGLLFTKILSQRTVEHRTTNQSTHENRQVPGQLNCRKFSIMKS